MLTAIWRGVRRFLSLRLLFDALWMDEPLYVVLRQYFYPFTWNPTAIYVWLMGAMVTLRLRSMRITSILGVPIPPDTLKPTAPVMLNRSWRRYRGAFAARSVRKTRPVITARAPRALKSSAPAPPVSWRTRWRRRYQLHQAQLKHAAWIAQNIFD